MSRVLICTLASGWYRALAPIFEYTAKRANPGCHVKVFDKDELFPGYADSSVSLLRFCIPNKYFHGYKYIHFTDIDFILLPHKVSLIDYHKRIIKETRQPYAGHKGPKKGKWVDYNSRIAGGAFMVTQEWLTKTWPFREKYAHKYKHGLPYREKDEVCLQRMTFDAGFRVPQEVGHFLNGEEYNKKYRDIHLGDFKQGFSHRWTDMALMKKKFLKDHNIGKYLKLCKEPEFNAMVDEAKKTPQIEIMFRHLETYLVRRLECLGS